jgi:hypothetical protein
MSEKVYRVTYDGIGIYEAMKKISSVKKWHDFLNSSDAKWLPKPPNGVYKKGSNSLSYFTKEGFEKFKETTLKRFVKELDKNKMHIDCIDTKVLEKAQECVYQDVFQKVYR